MSPASPVVAIGPIVERLKRRFEGTFSVETIERYVTSSTDQWSGARVTGYLPVLIERFAADRLRAVAKIQGRIMSETAEFLFVCVHNAGRSQLAAALLNHHAQGRVVVRSAGSAPADAINPAVVQAAAEVGLDLSTEFPKPLTEEATQAADVIITMGCGDACTLYPGKRYLDWEIPDPAGKTLEEVRPIRDEIDERVRQLLAELLPSGTPG